MDKQRCLADGATVATANPGRILIADDDESVYRFLIDLLEHEGYECTSARTADEALEILASRPHDLLITDIKMPGNESLAFLRDQKGTTGLPIIVITGHPTITTAVEALRLSVVDYMIKPLDPAQLLLRVSDAIGKGRVLRILRQTRADMVLWTQAVESLEAFLTAPVSKPGQAPRSVRDIKERSLSLFTQMLKHIAAIVDQMKVDGPKGTEICDLVHCRRRKAYEQSLRGAIATITESKHAFKSRELGDLRKTLEKVLDAQ